MLGFDGRVVPASFKRRIDKEAGEAGSHVMPKGGRDLAGEVWKDRPGIDAGKIWELPISSAGESAAEKTAAVRKEMAAEGADYLVLTDLMETAWLFNLRGSDIAYTPVFYSYTLLTADRAYLYVMDMTLESRLGSKLSSAEIRPYDQIYTDLAAIKEGTLWLYSGSCNHALASVISENVSVIDKRTPAAMMKIVKNDIEQRCSENAHIKDGIAVTKLIKWLKETMRSGGASLTEIDVASKLHRLRSEEEGFIEESFETISAYGANGAIIHYAPTEETNAEIRADGFLLLDSGGQYTDGTTDITRTIAVGPLTREMKEYYTYVLKAHIAMAVFEAETAGAGTEIDRAARKPLQDHGLDFNHGLSHGVGHVLGVHEGPNAVSKKEPEAGLSAGMIMSNEPGVYLEGRFGIRIENLVIWKESGRGTLVNRPLTCVPYEREAGVKELLTSDEIKWIDDYHKWTRETLIPLADGDTASFIEEVTAPL